MPDNGYATLEKAPPVPLDQVEWRVDGKPSEARQGGGHVSRFVPYIDASIVARLLDEWVGPGRWRDEYHAGELAGNRVLWCHLSIEVRPGEWVTKIDVGKPSSYEAEKGNVSDAFKRAASLKWGAGRNVYDLPGDLWAPCRTYTTNKGTFALPNADTIPALIRQLKERGFDTSGVKVKDAPNDDRPDEPATSDEPEPASDAESETRMELLELFNGLTQEYRSKVLDRLRTAGVIKRKTNGAIGTVAPEHFDTVRRTLEKAHESLASGAAEEPAGAEGEPSPGGGDAPSPPKANEDGEPWSAEKLAEGIEQYRSRLSDEERARWMGWLSEQGISGPAAEQSTETLWAMYAAIEDIAAGAPAS